MIAAFDVGRPTLRNQLSRSELITTQSDSNAETNALYPPDARLGAFGVLQPGAHGIG